MRTVTCLYMSDKKKEQIFDVAGKAKGHLHARTIDKICVSAGVTSACILMIIFIQE